mgnify:CR=1 FL=1
MVTTAAIGAAASALTDEEVVERVMAGETALFEILMRRYNQRLYRVTRSILGNDTEAEDVTQDAYVRSYMHLDQFDGRAKFSTWLTKIAVHEAVYESSLRLGSGEVSVALEGRAHAFSAKAADKITAAGGTVEVV